MNYDRDLLQALASIPPARWSGIVYRHMFASLPPDRENTLGARWNPPEVPAIYTSLARETVIAEAEYQMGMEPLRPPVRRTVYEIGLTLSAVLDLSSRSALSRLGISECHLGANDHSACQMVGGAVEHLNHDGLLVPSARLSTGVNLVIYPNRQTGEYQFQVLGQDIIFEP